MGTVVMVPVKGEAPLVYHSKRGPKKPPGFMQEISSGNPADPYFRVMCGGVTGSVGALLCLPEDAEYVPGFRVARFDKTVRVDPARILCLDGCKPPTFAPWGEQGAEVAPEPQAAQPKPERKGRGS
jgi:hypothetical protein